MLCADHATLQATSLGLNTAQHGVRIKNGHLSTVCRPPAQLRFLPATTWSYAKAVLTALISHKLNCSWILPSEIPIITDEEKLTVFVQEHESWCNIFKILSVLFPYTHDFLVSITSRTMKCCDIRRLWWSICVFSPIVIHTEISQVTVQHTTSQDYFVCICRTQLNLARK